MKGVLLLHAPDAESSSRVLLIASAGTLLFALFTSSVDEVELRNMSLFYELPIAFWVGLALLMLATALWWIVPRLTRGGFFLLFLWTFYLFVGPELMEPGPRGLDLHLPLIAYLKAKAGPELWQYSDFPGFYLLFAFVEDVSGLDYFALAKFAAMFLHLVRALAIWYLALSMFQDRRQALLFSLLVLSFLWVPLRLDPSPQNLALTLFLLSLPLFLRPGMPGFRRRLLAMILFSAIVVTHTLTAFLLGVFLLFTVLTGGLKKAIGANSEDQQEAFALNAGTTSALFLVLFVGWMLYYGDWSLEQGIRLFADYMRDPLASARYYTPGSPYRTFAFLLAYVFYGVVVLWLVLSIAKREFWGDLSFRRIFPILCVLPFFAALSTGFYRAESVDRVQLYAAPFVALFLAQASVKMRRVAPVLLCLLLLLTFANRYSQEYIQFLPRHEFSGARFVTQTTPAGEAVFIGKLWSPSLGAMADDPLGQPRQVDYESLREGNSPGKDFRFATYAPRWRNLVSFFYGEATWDLVRTQVYDVKKDIIYSNGDFEVYRYPEGS